MVILLTFGVTYPPLGVVICVTVFLDTLVTQHVVRESFVLEGEGSVRMLSVIMNVIYFVPLFYDGFLFDMVGDESGSVSTLWAPILMFCIPLFYPVLGWVMQILCVYVKEYMSVIPSSDATRNLEASVVRVGYIEVCLAQEAGQVERCQL